MPTRTDPVADLRARLAAGLRHHRLAAGLTQTDVADRAHVHLRSYQRVEAGHSAPKLDGLVRLSNALGVAPAELFAEKLRR